MARSPRRAGTTTAGTRERLLVAAATEFAARGFAGASVDRIARLARVNKAMIYYHFTSKAALYGEILRDMFAAVAVRAAATAASSMPPDEKIRAFVAGIALEADARPHFPPIWFREIAEQGSHLDDAIVASISSVLKALGRIIHEGVAAKRFAPINPILVHAGIIAPLLLYFASGAMRKRLSRGGVKGATQLTREEIVAHVQRVTLAMLEGQQS
jgi:TetR/AcrR family transcriptional regulator